MISFYTTCKGRLSYLKQTLPHNIQSIIESGVKAEVVVLDYASPDGLLDWIKETQIANIQSGVVNYYRYAVQGDFHIAHAKNIAASVSLYDIICGVDADHFISTKFIKNISRLADGEFISVCEDELHPHSLWGCVVCHKQSFQMVGGYNEDMIGYGFDDRDFVRRLRKLGLKQRPWGGKVDFLQNTRAERINHYSNKDIIGMSKKNEAIMNSAPMVVNTSRDWGKATLIRNFATRLSCSRGLYKPITMV